MFTSYVAVAVIILIVGVVLRKRRSPRVESRPRRAGSIGPGAAGAFYEMLNEERRRAIEIVVEDKAAYRSPENAEGDLPRLEKP
jgi:hypothetical protein